MKYKVDDRIKIRNWNSMEQEYGTYPDGSIRSPVIFTKSMKKWCAKAVTIKEVYLNRYHIKEDHIDGGWNWTDEMIDHGATRIISIIDRLEMLKKLDPVLEIFIDRDIKVLKSDNPIFNIESIKFYNNIFHQIKKRKET